MDHLVDLQRDGIGLVDAAQIAGLDAPVAHCPGWDVRRLVQHTAKVHQRTEMVVRTGAMEPPPREEFPRFADDDALFDQFRATLHNLVDTLGACDPEAPSWNFSSGPQVNAFWPRRMANETAIHRFDAELAAGRQFFSAGERAVDGIDELLTVLVKRTGPLKRPDLNATIHLHCTDHADGEWLVSFTDGDPFVTREHAKGDLAVRGPATSLFLWGYNRLEVGEGSLEAFGDESLLAAYADIAP